MKKTDLEKEVIRWESEELAASLRRKSERRDRFETSSGISVNRVYLPDPERDYMEMIGLPGRFPFTRGVQPTMYRSRYWTMRQYSGFGTARESNKRFRFLLEKGQTGLSVAFDLPTQIGYDSDHPMAKGEVGKVGVAIDSLDDMEMLLDGIPLDRVTTSMTINATAPILLSMVLVIAEKQGVPPEKLSGTVQNDILKEYIARGTYIYPPEPSLKIVTDIFEYCADHAPRWNTISVSGYHIREAGSTAVQEVAFTLADAVVYVEAALARGLEVDRFARQISFFFNAHNNLVEEVAKYRAARRMWARIMKERFHASDPRTMTLRFHTQTAGSTLTAQEPENNTIRVTLQALAAVLGGTQSLHTNAFDEALALPTEESALLALRIQQVIAHESGLADTIDALGGSFAVESLTDRIEEEALAYMRKLDDQGGMLRAIETGFVQSEIAKASYDYQLKLERGDEVVVGLNQYQTDRKVKPSLLKIDPKNEKDQRKSLQALREKRDSEHVDKALARVQEAAREKENLIPSIIDAVRAYATVGEVSDRLREVYGEYRERTAL